MIRPRMPKWFQPMWDWAGRTEDFMGRLRVLRIAALFGVGLSVIIGIILIRLFGAWGMFAFLVALAFLALAAEEYRIHRRITMSSASSDPTTEEAKKLVQEMRHYYVEQQQGLPPLELVLVGRSPSGALEAWKQERDAQIVFDFRRVFEPRLVNGYETLKARRGYGHPLMEGRYDRVRMSGEIITVARALAQMVGVPFKPIPAPGHEDDEASDPLGQEMLKFSRHVYSWMKDRLKAWPPEGVPEDAPVLEQNRVFDERMTAAFREQFLAEFQALYDKATARGVVDEVLEKTYEGPTSTLGMDVFIRRLRELAARLNQGNPES